jgi:glycolate oxidase
MSSSSLDAESNDVVVQRLTRREQVASELLAFMPESSVLWSEEQLRPYESDGLTVMKSTPLLVVLPDSVSQVQQILKWAAKTGTPVVARGAGTGLSGGALPHADGILLGLAKFNQILELNIEHGYARVQPGVRNLAISDAARTGSVLADSVYDRW